jgi:serine/threonine protein phosphatase PrpC
MEDACVVVPNLLELHINHHLEEFFPPRIEAQLRSSSGSERSGDVTTAIAAAAAAAVAAADNLLTTSSSTTTTTMPTSRPRITTATSSSTLSKEPQALLQRNESLSMETLHFFGVFDGHGGADAAMHCARTLHEKVKHVFMEPCADTAAASPEQGGDDGKYQDAVIETLSTESNISEYVDAAAAEEEEEGMHVEHVGPPLKQQQGNSTLDGLSPVSDHTVNGDDNNINISSSSAATGDTTKKPPTPTTHNCITTAEAVEAALTKAFHMTDEEFGALGGQDHLALVGTTAVVALVGRRMIYVANCGDSRAVLCRDGLAVPLTDDHKAAREDETARVEAAGGQILFWNGVRVMGLLAVSRAIGDHSLRPYVIAQPEVTIVSRSRGTDELMIMASDGLWDVMTNQEACTLAKKCLGRARQRGSTRQSAARVAATVLTRAAVDRGSRDNVTVVIVDLSPVTVEELEAEKLNRKVSSRDQQQGKMDSFGSNSGVGDGVGEGGEKKVEEEEKKGEGGAPEPPPPPPPPAPPALPMTSPFDVLE